MNATSCQLPSKEKGNHRQREKKQIQLNKEKAIDERPQRLSAVVAKIQMDDISSGAEELEENDNNDTDFSSESDSSDPDFY